jgi:hypothetical protein
MAPEQEMKIGATGSPPGGLALLTWAKNARPVFLPIWASL